MLTQSFSEYILCGLKLHCNTHVESQMVSTFFAHASLAVKNHKPIIGSYITLYKILNKALHEHCSYLLTITFMS
jgi:hypothetical protein